MCPKCSSDQWKLATLVHAEGSGSSGGIFVGGGVSDPANLSEPTFAVGGSRQSQSSLLAELAAPPEKPPKPRIKKIRTVSNRYTIKMLVSFVLMMAIIFVNDSRDKSNLKDEHGIDRMDGFEFLTFALVIGMTIYGLYAGYKSLYHDLWGDEARENKKRQDIAEEEWNEAHEEAMARYNRTRVCMRCGNFYEGPAMN